MPLKPGEVTITVGENFDPLPMGRYTVQIQDVSAVKQLNTFKGIEETRLKYTFVVLDDRMMPGKDPQGNPIEVTVRGRLLWNRFSTVMSTRSHLYKMVRAIYGRVLSKEEMEKFSPDTIVGMQVDVGTENKAGKSDPDTMFTNIISFDTTVKKLTPFTQADVPTTAPATAQTAPPITTATDPDAYMADMDKDLKQDLEVHTPAPSISPPEALPTPAAPPLQTPAIPTEDPRVTLAKAKLALAEAEAKVAKTVS